MHQFEPNVDHRMTDEEAQSVLRVLAERQRVRDDQRGRPSVEDVAALANAPISEVQSALAEVRAHYVPVEQPKRKYPVIVPLAAACVMMTVIIVAMVAFMSLSVQPIQPPIHAEASKMQEANLGPDSPTSIPPQPVGR